LVLCKLGGRDRAPIHPAKGLEIAAVIENRYVLANANLSGFRHRRIHHFLCELRRDAVFLHHVSHLNPPSLDTYCALIGVWVATRTGTPRRAGRTVTERIQPNSSIFSCVIRVGHWDPPIVISI